MRFCLINRVVHINTESVLSVKVLLLSATAFLCLLVIPDNAAIAGSLLSSHADYILVDKSERSMTLYSKHSKIKTYKIALGRKPLGPKLLQGDQKTPEGHYIIDGRNPDSRFYRSLHISYPNEIDMELTEQAGISPGGDIFIHGTGKEKEWMGKFHRAYDWTDGCIAVTDEEVDEIWQMVPDGTKIVIVP